MSHDLVDLSLLKGVLMMLGDLLRTSFLFHA